MPIEWPTGSKTMMVSTFSYKIELKSDKPTFLTNTMQATPEKITHQMLNPPIITTTGDSKMSTAQINDLMIE